MQDKRIQSPWRPQIPLAIERIKPRFEGTEDGTDQHPSDIGGFEGSAKQERMGWGYILAVFSAFMTSSSIFLFAGE
jgi:hypothetical protein